MKLNRKSTSLILTIHVFSINIVKLFKLIYTKMSKIMYTKLQLKKIFRHEPTKYIIILFAGRSNQLGLRIVNNLLTFYFISRLRVLIIDKTVVTFYF